MVKRVWSFWETTANFLFSWFQTYESIPDVEASCKASGIFDSISNHNRKLVHFGNKRKNARLFSSGNLQLDSNMLLFFKASTESIIWWLLIFFYQVQGLGGRLTDMGVTEILPRKTYNIKVYCQVNEKDFINVNWYRYDD